VSEGFEDGKRAGDEDPLVTQCLRFVLSNEAVSCVIPGMRNAAEVKQNVRMAEDFRPMSHAEQDQLIRAIGQKKGTYRYDQICLQCGYCQPCPQGVNAPAIFRARMMVESYPHEAKGMGYALYESLAVKAEGCVECRKCVEKCPAGLDIPKLLKEAAKVLARPAGK
jgi:hypothetical protein